MLYRCPTCRTKYTMTGKGIGQPEYVKCQVCGFLIEAISNAIDGVPPPRPKPETRRAERRSYLPIIIALMVVCALAWIIASAVKWASSVN